jgi:hypothetical protein
MISYYFVRIPKLARDISHQSGAVTLIEYAAREGQMIQPGMALS